jgi:hypothetical protein
MSSSSRIYLVGRKNSTVHCDIALPANESSVSRNHLELTVTEDGRFYVVHLHPRNTTQQLTATGAWERVSQTFVEIDTPLMLGSYQTTVRNLLDLLPREQPAPPPPPPPEPPPPPTLSGDERVEFDAERGTYIIVRPK